MSVKVKKIALPQASRVICVSDIHGSLNEFRRLLAEVGFGESDALILLGDLFLKGKQPRETLEFIINLAENSNVHALLGNCDWDEDLTGRENAWLGGLPHIIDAGEFIFVHAGLKTGELEAQDEWFCMKNDAFLETAAAFPHWVVTGHWPVINYRHEIPSCNPIVNADKRIIAIDGGMVVQSVGQLNAFIIENGEFSYHSVDSLPTAAAAAPQSESGGFSITWLDRFVEVISEGAEFSLCRHTASGRELEIANDKLFEDRDGRLGCGSVTDYCLPLATGDTFSVIREYSDRYFAKRGGIVGWVSK
ncbi:MAG: metallophosphoesterase [Oscillospiraceae bacterium]|jgi:hypothetical protein|nr:metallophosphoesterase [Oscillospiraceae bacterium]